MASFLAIPTISCVQVQPLDVEKIKHVKSFTYAPVYSVQVAAQDSILKQIITQAAFLHPKPK
ncbi:hypothetical protein [Xanthocytophaga agilis]|uniref:Uncharacterized protein n=1 Tax=Xanthocytophaga agilis TaxID=3048010 RepID=A0AAE3R8S6_9BACT|nr:hypothetical protein [Xanthocytophaga agilis]MDJ1503544.1 hypothetical protein [Xanthocytophaga agilis]